jgi:hypothetical protein
MLASWVYLVGARVFAVANGVFDGDNVGMPMSAGGSTMVVFTGPPKCSGSAAPALARVDPSTAGHVPMAMSALAPTAADINLNLLNFTVDHSQNRSADLGRTFFRNRDDRVRRSYASPSSLECSDSGLVLCPSFRKARWTTVLVFTDLSIVD